MTSRRSIGVALSLAAAVAVLVPGDAWAQTDAQLLVCAKRTARAFKRFSTVSLGSVGDCEVDSLKAEERNQCTVDQNVIDDFASAADRLRREMRKCNRDALRALCPHSSRDDEELEDQVLNDENGTGTRMYAFDHDLFTRPFDGLEGSCPASRPVGEISRSAQDCADRMGRLVSDGLDDLQKCLYKCELSRMSRGGEKCLQENGEPGNEKVLECYDRIKEDLEHDLSNECTPDLLIEIGCPLDQTTVPGLALAIGQRLYQETRKMSSGIFQSSCGGSGGSGTGGTLTVPVPVTLLPSQRKTHIDCGQTLDDVFFGTDDEVRLDGHVDCGPAGMDSIGLVIAASDVTLNGRRQYDVSGPSRSRNRTGIGILVAPGATNVTIKEIRKIQRYAIGISDSGDNDRLSLERITLRRNKTAGVVTTSTNVRLDFVKADRNGIGFDVSGDGSTIQDSRALRSTPAPGIGILLGGIDEDEDGRVVRVNRSKIEENMVGIVLNTGPHLLEDNEVRRSLGDGIHILSDGSKVESNSVKQNLGNGLRIEGHLNNITANRSDENTEYGYWVTGIANDLNNNGAGTKSDLGNLKDGYLLQGVGTIVRDNFAEANLGNGFTVDETTSVFKGNDADNNSGIGFDVNGQGNHLDTNVASANGSFEFSVVAGTTEAPGTNRTANGTIAISEWGGHYE